MEKVLLEEAITIRNVVITQPLNKILSLLKKNFNHPRRMQKVAFLLLVKEMNFNVPHNSSSVLSQGTQTERGAASNSENVHVEASHTNKKCQSSVSENCDYSHRKNVNCLQPVPGPECVSNSSNNSKIAPSVLGCKKALKEPNIKMEKVAAEAQPGPSQMVTVVEVTDTTEKSKSKVKNEYKGEETVLDDVKIIDNILILDDSLEIATKEQKNKYVKTLKDMFPDADLKYLIELCETAHQNPEWLNATITNLLKGDYLKDIKVDVVPNNTEVKIELFDEDEIKDIIEKNFIKFIEILPDADPTYLRDCAEQCGNDEQAVTTLITHLFETRNYPTVKDYLNRQKTISIQRKYIDFFNVEEFLEIFPDPIKYFSDKDRHNEDSIDYDLTYLKARYRFIKLDNIRDCYQKNGKNLTRTCEELDTHKNNMRRIRRDHEIKYPETMNIPFIQELAFIENKALIISFLEQKKLKREEAYKKAKENGEFLECSCCFDEEILSEDAVTCNEGHIFCKPCVQKYVETCMGDGKTSFPCLMGCDMEFSLHTLQGVLKASVFSRLLQKKQSAEVNAAGIPGLENCPFCDFAMIPPQDDKVFRCLNSECMKHSCRSCKTEDHIPLRCDEVEKSDEIKVRTYIEDKMTEALIRICWKCQKKFIKEDGCNKMMCVCGAMMCYLCRQPVQDYKHFNAQGGAEYEKCPLYSNNNELHLKAIIKEGIKAKALVMSENPDVKLKHDPTTSFPRPSTSKCSKHAAAHRDVQVLANVARGPRKRRLDDA